MTWYEKVIVTGGRLPMAETRLCIEYLKKITVYLQGAQGRGKARASEDGYYLSFIYGIGPDGLTPFEMKIAGKTAGDELFFDKAGMHLDHLFGHLTLWMLPFMERLDHPWLYVRVEKVEAADQKEVIRALAEIAQSRDSCCCS